MKNVASTKASKKVKNVEVHYGASTPRGFAELHLQRLRKESEQSAQMARAITRLLGANDKAIALRSEFESLNAEVNSLDALFKKTDKEREDSVLKDKVADQSTWEAMQLALKQRHQAELEALKTAAKLAGCKGKLRRSESESDSTSYASTPSTFWQCRDTEVDAGHVSDQSNTGSASDNSKGSKASTKTPDTPGSDEDSKSDKKGSDSEDGTQPATPSLVLRREVEGSDSEDGTQPATPPFVLRRAVEAPTEATVPQPRWVPQLKLAPRPCTPSTSIDAEYPLMKSTSIDDMNPFISELDLERLKPRDEAPAVEPVDVLWTPRLFNGEDEQVHTPPMSDDDLVANPREDTEEFAMTHAKWASETVQSRHQFTPRNLTPYTREKSAPNLLVKPPVDTSPVPPAYFAAESALWAIESAAQVRWELPFDLTPREPPLTARSPARGQPLETSEMVSAPVTARGPRQRESSLTQEMSSLAQEIEKQHEHEWKRALQRDHVTQTNAVLHRAMQTLASFEGRPKTPLPVTPRAVTPVRTPRSLTPPVPGPMYNPVQQVPLASPHMMPAPTAQPAPAQVVPMARMGTQKVPDASPTRAAMLRTPNSQPQLGSHSPPNITRRAQPVSHLQGQTPSPAAGQIFGTQRLYAKHMPPPLSAQSHRPWGYGRPM